MEPTTYKGLTASQATELIRKAILGDAVWHASGEGGGCTLTVQWPRKVVAAVTERPER